MLFSLLIYYILFLILLLIPQFTYKNWQLANNRHSLNKPFPTASNQSPPIFVMSIPEIISFKTSYYRLCRSLIIKVNRYKYLTYILIFKTKPFYPSDEQLK